MSVFGGGKLVRCEEERRGEGRGEGKTMKNNILTLSLTSDRWGHSVTPNNSLKSSPNVFKFYILLKDHMLDSLWVFLRSENGILLYV